MNEYFQHDYNCRNHPKMKALKKEFGAEGYGVFWMIAEYSHEKNGEPIAHDYEWEAIADDCSTGVEHVLNIVERCCSKFRLMVKTDAGITLPRTIENLENRNRVRDQKSNAGKASADKRKAIKELEKSDPTPVEHPLNSVATESNKEKEKKEKEIKEKEIKENTEECARVEIQKNEIQENEKPGIREVELNDAWNHFRTTYPNTEGIDRCRNEFYHRLVGGNIPGDLVKARVDAYARMKSGTEPRYIKRPMNFLTDGLLSEDWEAEEKKAVAGPKVAQVATSGGGIGKGISEEEKARLFKEAREKTWAKMQEEKNQNGKS